MKLDYIYHSGFAIELENTTIIIDYFKDSSDTAYNHGIVHDYLLKKSGKLYVLSTHSHPDHFNPEILEWKKLHEDIVYIFSSDIRDNHKAKANDAIFLNKGEEYKDSTIKIHACGSTDIGISFMIDIANCRIFHAGDLNNWHWSEESTLEEIEKANLEFLNELENIYKYTKQVDIAMFPVDNRMGKNYYKGAQQFVEKIKTSIFVPMHFDSTYKAANDFEAIAEKNGCRFLEIQHRGEIFEINK